LTPRRTDPMSRGRTQRSVRVKGTALFTGALIERRPEIGKVLAVPVTEQRRAACGRSMLSRPTAVDRWDGPLRFLKRW
jgi:hypothetical protein